MSAHEGKQRPGFFTPAEFAANYGETGAKKSGLPVLKMLVAAVLAGLFIGLGGAVVNTATHTVSNAGLARVVGGLLFPFGLIMVMATGAELFTGNMLITISVLSKKARLSAMLKNWLFVFIGNFAGAALLAAACAYFGQLELSGGALAVHTMKVAAAKCALPFGNAFVLGIFCNILVCAGVMCASCAKDFSGRAIGAVVPVSFFVICGFEHCVANMYLVPAGLFAAGVPKYSLLAAQAGLDLSALTWGNFLYGNLLPVTLGNIVGGVLFALAVWYGNRAVED